MLIDLKAIEKRYQSGGNELFALSGITLQIDHGEKIAITGPSGSGKSTLMNIIGLLDRPTAGEFILAGQPVSLNAPDRELAALRSEQIGFVFQSFNLLPRLTALDNLLLPTLYRQLGRADRRERALSLLEAVGLSARAYHLPTQLSGGEKQRVAIARALINQPEIILADEPTGNLDSKSGQEVVAVLDKLNQEGKTLVIITHDKAIADSAPRQIRLLDGRIVEDNREPKAKS